MARAQPTPEGGDASVYLVKGEDASLVAQAARALIEEVVGARDPALVVEEHGGSAIEDFDAGAVIDACTTPPFLVDQRVVVVRDAGRLSAADAVRLIPTVRDPLPSTVLVLVGGGGTIPQALIKAVSERGRVIDTTVGRDRAGWLAQQLRQAPVRLDPSATALVSEHLGEDLGRLAGILQTLEASYGEGSSVGVDEIAPYLGAAGSVPSWDLTDAIDAGSAAQALTTLHRMMGSGALAPPQVVAVLHKHFSNMLRLDGADVTSGEEAASLLGVRSSYVGKKALAQCARLGRERVGQAIALIADADLDIKGRTALPSEAVLEVLVARLARLVRPRASTGRRR